MSSLKLMGACISHLAWAYNQLLQNTRLLHIFLKELTILCNIIMLEYKALFPMIMCDLFCFITQVSSLLLMAKMYVGKQDTEACHRIPSASISNEFASPPLKKYNFLAPEWKKMFSNFIDRWQHCYGT